MGCLEGSDVDSCRCLKISWGFLVVIGLGKTGSHVDVDPCWDLLEEESINMALEVGHDTLWWRRVRGRVLFFFLRVDVMRVGFRRETDRRKS